MMMLFTFVIFHITAWHEIALWYVILYWSVQLLALSCYAIDV